MVDRDPTLTASINPRLRKSPFFDCTVRAGLVAVTGYNHMWLPTSYGDADAEYRRLVEGVSMWDVSAQRHVQVAGDAADELVQLVTAIDVDRAEPGRGIYAPMVDAAGRLINDPILLRVDDGTWRFSIADADVRLWIAGVAAGRSMAATVTELDTATLAVQGPRAEAVMADLGLGWISDMEDLERRSAQIDGIEVLVSRSGWSKQGGVELFLDDVDHAEQLWRAVEAAGRPHGIGPGAPNQSERIENVLLSYGTDTGFDANPLELGLEDHLDLDGPDFIGRDALRRVRSDGPQRQLLGALVSGERINRFGHPTTVRIAGDDVGQLRAAAWSPKYSTNLGLALVAAEVAVGSSARTSTPDGERTLTLVELPFADELPAPG